MPLSLARRSLWGTMASGECVQPTWHRAMEVRSRTCPYSDQCLVYVRPAAGLGGGGGGGGGWLPHWHGCQSSHALPACHAVLCCVARSWGSLPDQHCRDVNLTHCDCLLGAHVWVHGSRQSSWSYAVCSLGTWLDPLSAVQAGS